MLSHHLPLTFGAVIRSRRKDLHLSQEDLGFRSGLHRTYLADIERGVRNPTLISIGKIAKALNVSLSDLFTNIQSASNQPTQKGLMFPDKHRARCKQAIITGPIHPPSNRSVQ